MSLTLHQLSSLESEPFLGAPHPQDCLLISGQNDRYCLIIIHSFYITFVILKYCLVIYSLLYLNTLIQMSFYIRLHFYFEDEKCQVLKSSATTQESCYSQSA